MGWEDWENTVSSEAISEWQNSSFSRDEYDFNRFAPENIKEELYWKKECEKSDILSCSSDDSFNFKLELAGIDTWIMDSKWIKDYCSYFGVDEKDCDKDVSSAVRIISKFPEPIRSMVNWDIPLFLAIKKESEINGNSIDYSYVISQAIIESSFWTEKSRTYKWPLQIWPSVIKSIASRPDLYDESRLGHLEWVLWKDVKKLKTSDCDNPFVCSTIWFMYLDVVSAEWNFKTPSDKEISSYYRWVSERVSSKWVNISKWEFTNTINSIPWDPEKNKTFNTLRNYNWSSSKNTYALAIMSFRDLLFWNSWNVGV